MAEIALAGEPFHFLVEGDQTKDALVLAHHLGGALEFWDPLMPAFLKHFRVLRFDMRGHGSSVAGEGPYSIAGLAQDALGLLDALGIEKAHWLGLSMGAFVAQAVLISAPERVGRAVLVSAAAQIGAPDLWNSRIAMARADLEGMTEATAERWFTPEFRAAEPEAVSRVMDIFRKTSAEGYAGGCAALRDVDLREAIRSVSNKVLVIVGRHDPAAPPPLGAYVAGAIPGAKLVTLEASHLSPIEDREGFLAAAIDFLTAADAPARKAAAPRKIARRTAARQALGRAPAPKAAGRPAPRKTAEKKAAAKAAAKRAAVSKSPAKAPARKAAVKKSAAKKAPAKAALGKATARAAAKKAPAKKPPAKKAAAKKAAGKKVTVKKAAAKKTSAKASPRTAAKKPSGRRT